MAFGEYSMCLHVTCSKTDFLYTLLKSCLILQENASLSMLNLQYSEKEAWLDLPTWKGALSIPIISITHLNEIMLTY